MFLLHLSEQLTSEELEKLAYLMYPQQCNDQFTAAKLRLGLADLLEKGENVISLQFVHLLSTCLDAIGRADLVQHLCSLVGPQILLSSFSTSQQQLDLKISLLFHSKHQSYDFHMRALATLERDDDYRVRVLGPLMKELCEFCSRSTILPLAQKLQIVMQSWSHPEEFDELIQTSLKMVSEFDQAYWSRKRIIKCSKELDLKRLHSLNSKCTEAYKEFDSIMSSFEWNADVRSEEKRNEKC